MEIRNLSHAEIARNFIARPGMAMYDPEGCVKELTQILDAVSARSATVETAINLADGVDAQEASLAGSALAKRRRKAVHKVRSKRSSRR